LSLRCETAREQRLEGSRVVQLDERRGHAPGDDREAVTPDGLRLRQAAPVCGGGVPPAGQAQRRGELRQVLGHTRPGEAVVEQLDEGQLIVDKGQLDLLDASELLRAQGVLAQRAVGRVEAQRQAPAGVSGRPTPFQLFGES
jgi:hypothetical protein